MRKVINEQMLFEEVDVSQIKIDEESRDDIPQVLIGLQHIYKNTQTRKQVFDILERGISPNRSAKNGRPGMDLWKIFVLGTLRLTINCDYDRLVELANNHSTLRQMLGHGMFNKLQYGLQTVKDNICLLTTAMLDEINMVVVQAGHALCKKKTSH